MADPKIECERLPNLTVTVDDVNRVLEIGQLLMSVLTPEEVEQLQRVMTNADVDGLLSKKGWHQAEEKIGNIGVT
jgi:hypothetical protein